MKYVFAIVAVSCLCASAHAEPVLEKMTYNLDGKTFNGVIAYDKALKGPLPGMLVVPEWWGLNDFVKKKAMEIASIGYVAFAVDMYGGGVTTTPGRPSRPLPPLSSLHRFRCKHPPHRHQGNRLVVRRQAEEGRRLYWNRMNTNSLCQKVTCGEMPHKCWSLNPGIWL